MANPSAIAPKTYPMALFASTSAAPESGSHIQRRELAAIQVTYPPRNAQ